MRDIITDYWMNPMDLLIDGIFKKKKRTFIIAEIGSNHNQDKNLAFQTIDAAVEAGADAVKFQSINIEELYLSPNNSIKKLHRKIDLEEDWHYSLKKYCDSKRTIFFSTPTYLRSVDILEKIDVQLYKIASAQAGTFPQLVEKVVETEKPVLLSTGLTTYGDLEKIVRLFRRKNNNHFVILHCNSIYPTPYDKVNLRLIGVYKSMFGNPVGFSDHTQHIYISLAAVTLGAAVIEKHFTLNKKLLVPDAAISLDPHEFKSMVDGIRAIEKSMQFKDRIFIEEEENVFKNDICYRLILKNNKMCNDSFLETDFDFKRHPVGIDCNDLKIVLNYMKAQKDLPKGTLLSWDLLTGK